MLESMHVKNLALIEEENVEFKQGLNILTGETGAGKSIIIGSVSIALGAKAGADIIRNGATEAYVELAFSVDDDNTLNELKKYDISDIDEGQVIISRKLSGNRSVSKVNGETVPLSKLRQISSLLIDIHGQHDHQSLLDATKHLDILDDYLYSEIKDMKSELYDLYNEYVLCQKKYDEFSLNEDERLREAGFLEFEINELEEANLNVSEEKELEEKFKLFSNAKKIIENISKSLSILGDNVSDAVSSACKYVTNVSEYDERINKIGSELTDLESLTFDVIRDLENYASHFEYDEEEFFNISERIDLFNKLKNKYGGTVEKCLSHLEDCKAKLEILKDYENNKKKAEDSLKKAYDKLLILCEKLSSIRKSGAKELEQKIIDALVDLNFNDVRFKIKFTQKETVSSKGYDEAEFLISTNPGEDLKSLSKVASGGELSRVMLALKSVAANKDNIDTLIFDEIDSGISGVTAARVASKMKDIAKSRQVIAITHLAQIASVADTHFVIKKIVEDGKTHTSIEELDYDASVMELCRILGGENVTDAVVRSAKEMKSNY